MAFIIGELNESDIVKQKQVEWKISNFAVTDLSLSSSQRVSPSFTLEDISLHFVLSENNFLSLHQSEYVCPRFGSHLPKETPLSLPLNYSFSIKNFDGQLIGTKTFTSSIGKTKAGGFKFSIDDALRQNKTGLKVADTLTIVCQLQIVPEATKEDSLDDDTTVKSLEHLHHAGVSNFFNELKEMLLNGKFSDFTMNVKDKEFKVHKNILAARSPVFTAMFEHDMKEKDKNNVNIEDCEPDIFSEFLSFLYTGKIENQNSDNALDLYEIAEKYQVTELSSLCVKYMIDNISIENNLDILALGLLHNMTELIDVATQFFLQNSREIAVTAKWLTFLTKNPVAGNELFLKSMNLNKK